MPLKLHLTLLSPPCRATLLTIRALDIDVELVQIDLGKHQHLTTEFVQINPFHTVPTLQDGDFNLWDSHAINSYLVDKYATEDSLYPKDLEKRATINQRLHFDSNVLSARLTAIVRPILKDGSKVVTKDKSDALLQGVTLLENILENSKFTAGNSLTIADFSIVATITSANTIIPLASNRFPKTFEWLARMEALPYYKEANEEGLNMFANLIRSKNIMRQSSTK